MSITDSTFLNNTNTAVYLVTDGSNFATNSSCSFIGNSAANLGAGLTIGVLQGPDSNGLMPLQATITSSTFSNNLASQGGAAVISNQVLLRPYNCTLSNLTVFNNSATSEGGAFWLQQVNLNISDSDFTQNSAQTDPSNSVAGGIYLKATCARSAYISSQYSPNPFACSAIISNTTFLRNVAAHNGGALYLKVDGYAVSISRSRFISNHITTSGGAGAALDLIPAISGAGLSRLLVLSESNFTSNTAPESALGAVTIQQVAFMAVQSCIFDSNAAGVGAAIFTTQVNSDESTCWSQAFDSRSFYVRPPTANSKCLRADAASTRAVTKCPSPV